MKISASIILICLFVSIKSVAVFADEPSAYLEKPLAIADLFRQKKIDVQFDESATTAIRKLFNKLNCSVIFIGETSDLDALILKHSDSNKAVLEILKEICIQLKCYIHIGVDGVRVSSKWDSYFELNDGIILTPHKKS